MCPVEKLCEGSCVFNLLDEKPIPIAKLQRYATDRAIKDKWKFFDRKPTTGKKVAIIGAGPAGLSCAHALSREGVDVTVYEKESKGGGLMTYGVAAYKVTSEFCQEEVDFITSLGGITIKYNHSFGKDIILSDLQKQYDAVYMAIGVGLANQLNIPGEDLIGVVDAISFIYDVRAKGYPNVEVGEKVAVIGMGMTAIDAATQAKRLGAKEVTMVYRRTENEKSCTQAELDIAKLDGCKIHWLAAPKRIGGKDGKVESLVCDVMKPGPPDHKGKPTSIPTGETILLEVDMIIKATGQSPFEKLITEGGIDNSKGRILINDNMQASLQGVFAGGDAVNGGKEVVNAVQDGKNGAAYILKYLNAK